MVRKALREYEISLAKKLLETMEKIARKLEELEQRGEL